MVPARKPLHGVRVAILVADGFEQAEMVKPRDALLKAGATGAVVSPAKQRVRAWNGDEPGDAFDVDVSIAAAEPSDFDALLLPGGVRSCDALRVENKAVLFAHALQVAQKPIAAIGHGPWLLIETGFVRGRQLTSWPSLRTDVLNGGGNWADEAVVRDGLLLTSRMPTDLPRFNKGLIEAFAPREVEVKT